MTTKNKRTKVPFKIFLVLAACLLVLLCAANASALEYEVTVLGTLGGDNSHANAINDAGQVVGDSKTGSGDRHAFLWTQAGGMVDLGTLGGDGSKANGINEAGQVVGWSRTDSGDGHAFLWSLAGGMVDLGTLPGGDDSEADAINDAGQVVGDSRTGSGDVHAFLWSQSGGMVDLGTLGGDDSRAFGVNDAGQVVGWSKTDSGDLHAFLWTQADGMVDLNDYITAKAPAGIILSNAIAIANNGWIAANSNLGAVLLTPIYEMSSATTTKAKVDWDKDKFEITGEIPYPAKPDINLSYEGSAGV